MKVSDGKMKEWYEISELDLDITLKRRLEAIGLTEGSDFQLINKKRNGTSIVRSRGARWAIGKEIADGIICKEIKHEENN